MIFKKSLTSDFISAILPSYLPMDLSSRPQILRMKQHDYFLYTLFPKLSHPTSLPSNTAVSPGRRLSSLQRIVLSSYFSVSLSISEPKYGNIRESKPMVSVSVCGLTTHTGLFYPLSQPCSKGGSGEDSVSCSYPGTQASSIKWLQLPGPHWILCTQ